MQTHPSEPSPQAVETHPARSWPAGGGGCGALIRAFDWGATALGPIERWSPALRITVANIVNTPVPKMLMWGPDHLVLYNDAYRQVLGDRHPAALGAGVHRIWPELEPLHREALRRGLAGQLSSDPGRRVEIRRGGQSHEAVLDLSYTPVFELDGTVGGVMGTAIDNGALLRAERDAATRAAGLRAVADALPVLIATVDAGQRYGFANARYGEWLGVHPDWMIGRTVRDVLGAERHDARAPLLRRALAGEAVTFEDALPRRDGGVRHCETRYLPIPGPDGSVTGLHILTLDIEDRVRRAAEQDGSNRRFRAAMRAVHGILWTNSADGRMLGEQPGWAALTGQRFEEYQGFGWSNAVHPDDAAATVTAWNDAVSARATFVHEHRVRRHDGEWRAFAIRALPLIEHGEIVEWVGVHTDITHRRAAEQALRAQADQLSRQVAHRRRAEEQLRQLNEGLEARVLAEIGERREAERRLAQAQKMESVGQLTGGVAHDFNNLLQVVSGNLQLLGRDIAGQERAERRVANAMQAVTRGARLAAQLLAFGRRQALEPRVVDLSGLLDGIGDILRRAVGDGVEITASVAPALWNSLVDPTQIENALLNLAINARDAMDGQGRLTVELGNAELDAAFVRGHDGLRAGQYVMLAVSDTGCGMAPEILDKVFEPFFSTKPEGKGSGLGLSMVWGFVKQSGGHVRIHSEPGQGTTIRLYLPRAAGAAERTAEPEAGPLRGGSETVLVVEDDPAVRATVVEMLGDLGYRVLKAVDATGALSVLESGVPVDLLFTDVVMPGPLKSPEMARRAQDMLPGLSVLFTSGYTENAIVHGGRLDPGLSLLSKPYTREALARKLRHVLDNAAQRAGGAVREPAPAASGPARAGDDRVPVLLVEDDALIRGNSAEVLADAGFAVSEAGTAEEALAMLRTGAVAVLVTDINLPGTQGPELAARARALLPSLGIVFASGDAAPLIRGELAGTVSLPKPYSARALVSAIRRAMPANARAHTHARPEAAEAAGD